MSAGQTIEIYKEIGPARGVRAPVRPRRPPGDARARPHAHGDREPGDHGGLAPLLDRPRPLPRPQRLALEPQPPAREPAARGDRVPDGERHRGRRRATSPGGCGRAPRSRRRSKAASRTSTASTPSSSGPTDGFAVLRDPIACKPAVLAETDDWVAMASEWRAIAVLPGAAEARIVGARARRRLRVGAGEGLMSRRGRGGRRGRRPRGDAAARAEPAPARPRRRTGAGAAGACSTRTARTRSPAASTRRSRSRSRGTSATTAPA